MGVIPEGKIIPFTAALLPSGYPHCRQGSPLIGHQASQYILNRKLGADAYGGVYAAEHPLHRIADRAEEWSRSSVKGPTRRMSRIRTGCTANS